MRYFEFEPKKPQISSLIILNLSFELELTNRPNLVLDKFLIAHFSLDRSSIKITFLNERQISPSIIMNRDKFVIHVKMLQN